MPVLPAVPSTIVPPGLSSPCASASRMIHSAARSFTEAPGLANSHLPQISQPAASLGPLRSTSGVLPMRSSALVWTAVRSWREELGAATRCASPQRSVLFGDPDLEPVELVGERNLARQARSRRRGGRSSNRAGRPRPSSSAAAGRRTPDRHGRGRSRRSSTRRTAPAVRRSRCRGSLPSRVSPAPASTWWSPHRRG